MARRPMSREPAAAADTTRWFDDEIAIDFPAMGAVVDRMRGHLLGPDTAVAAQSAAVRITSGEAGRGAVVPLAVPLGGLCPHCGGRGECWSEPCGPCAGSGERPEPHEFRLLLPAGTVDGARYRFVVAPPRARPTRIEVTVSVA